MKGGRLFAGPLVIYEGVQSGNVSGGYERGQGEVAVGAKESSLFGDFKVVVAAVYVGMKSIERVEALVEVPILQEGVEVSVGEEGRYMGMESKGSLKEVLNDGEPVVGSAEGKEDSGFKVKGKRAIVVKKKGGGRKGLECYWGRGSGKHSLVEVTNVNGSRPRPTKLLKWMGLGQENEVAPTWQMQSSSVANSVIPFQEKLAHSFKFFHSTIDHRKIFYSTNSLWLIMIGTAFFVVVIAFTTKKLPIYRKTTFDRFLLVTKGTDNVSSVILIDGIIEEHIYCRRMTSSDHLAFNKWSRKKKSLPMAEPSVCYQ